MRPARPDELAAVGELTGRVYLDENFLDGDDGYLPHLQDARTRAAEAELWVAVEDGRLLGTVTFTPAGSSYREIARADEGEFRMLAVAPEARGRGVGRLLVELCLARSRELGYAGVRMSSLDRMRSAHRLYEQLGFLRAPEDDWEPQPGVSLRAYRVRL